MEPSLIFFIEKTLGTMPTHKQNKQKLSKGWGNYYLKYFFISQYGPALHQTPPRLSDNV